MGHVNFSICNSLKYLWEFRKHTNGIKCYRVLKVMAKFVLINKIIRFKNQTSKLNKGIVFFILLLKKK